MSFVKTRAAWLLLTSLAVAACGGKTTAKDSCSDAGGCANGGAPGGSTSGGVGGFGGSPGGSGGLGGYSGFGGSPGGSGGSGGFGGSSGGSGGDGGFGGTGALGGGTGYTCNATGSTPGSCDPGGSNDPCALCVQAKCCTEWSACLGTMPNNACGWGTPAGYSSEIECFQGCVVEETSTNGLSLDDANSKCGNKCVSPGCGTIAEETNDLVTCVEASCFVECFST